MDTKLSVSRPPFEKNVGDSHIPIQIHLKIIPIYLFHLKKFIPSFHRPYWLDILEHFMGQTAIVKKNHQSDDGTSLTSTILF